MEAEKAAGKKKRKTKMGNPIPRGKQQQEGGSHRGLSLQAVFTGGGYADHSGEAVTHMEYTGSSSLKRLRMQRQPGLTLHLD